MCGRKNANADANPDASGRKNARQDAKDAKSRATYARDFRSLALHLVTENSTGGSPKGAGQATEAAERSARKEAEGGSLGRQAAPGFDLRIRKCPAPDISDISDISARCSHSRRTI